MDFLESPRCLEYQQASTHIPLSASLKVTTKIKQNLRAAYSEWFEEITNLHRNEIKDPIICYSISNKEEISMTERVI